MAKKMPMTTKQAKEVMKSGKMPMQGVMGSGANAMHNAMHGTAKPAPKKGSKKK